MVVLDEDGHMVPIRALGQQLAGGGLFRLHFTIVKLTEAEGLASDFPWN